MIDSTGLINILANVDEGILDILRSDALDTLSLFSIESNSDEKTFSELFLKDRRALFARFDTVLRLPVSSSVDTKKALKILRAGLGDRCTIVHLTSTHLLLSHNPTQFGRLVDHGPASPIASTAANAADESISDPEGDAFRTLWGPKAELRRFKDGRINEAVVWEGITSRFLVASVVASYLLDYHFGTQVESVSYEDVLPTLGIEAKFRDAREALEGVLKTLKSLDEKDGLPLGVTGLSPASPLLRSTSPFPPQDPAGILGWSEPINVVLEYERNTKWPDDFDAVQNVKLALLERTAACLMVATSSSIVARVVVPPEEKSKALLEIITKDGWIFHARIWYDREVKLLSAIGSKDSNLRAAQMYRDMVHAPRHHRTIFALVYQHPAFAPTVRLLTRWLASHWVFGGQGVNAETVELICAALFTGKGRNIPGTREVGFARAVEFLKEWKWEEEGGSLDVQLVEKTAESVGQVEKPEKDNEGFISAKGKGVWTIRTDLDAEGRVWTHDFPDSLVALRMRELAKATWEILNDMESRSLSVKVCHSLLHILKWIAHTNWI